jgi:hypothetical protein
MLAFSRMIKMECEKYQIKYFDTSHNFIEAIGEAETYLYK